MTLVILAAGLGSRFGGLKQIEPVDDEGNFIIDYSVKDAVCAGFDKIVFVIKEENYELFKNTIGSRVSKLCKVEYAFQRNDNLEKYISIPSSRKKPFGTAHALLCAKDYIDGPFGIISSDDFYGYGAFKQLHDYLKKGDNVVIGYLLKNTMSENGSVKRGVCFSKDGYLTLNDDYKIERIGSKIIGESNQDNLDDCEILLPNVLTEMINDNQIKIKVVPTEEKWMGITYKEDLEALREYIKNYNK